MHVWKRSRRWPSWPPSALPPRSVSAPSHPVLSLHEPGHPRSPPPPPSCPQCPRVQGCAGQDFGTLYPPRTPQLIKREKKNQITPVIFESIIVIYEKYHVQSSSRSSDWAPPPKSPLKNPLFGASGVSTGVNSSASIS